jgi:predicted transcriptional regulator
MFVKASHVPMMAQADGSGGGPIQRQSTPARRRRPKALVAPPLPSDPAVLTEIRAGIDRGLAQARAGIGYDLDEVLADMDRKIAAHQK